MQCPVCSLALIVVERKGIELDYCINCRGFWFDSGELKLLPQALGVTVSVPDLDSLPPEPSSEKPRSCPRCRAKMDKVCIQDSLRTLVDRCPNGDGLWFDAGELGKAFSSASPKGDAGGEGIVAFLGETFTAGR